MDSCLVFPNVFSKLFSAVPRADSPGTHGVLGIWLKGPRCLTSSEDPSVHARTNRRNCQKDSPHTGSITDVSGFCQRLTEAAEGGLQADLAEWRSLSQQSFYY